MDNIIVEIDTKKLDFDPQNPRFFRLNDAGNASTVIEEMLDDESVHDLMLSIGQQGYFPGEPLLAVEDGDKYIVVEGNRRLAAVKLLNGDLHAPKRKLKGVLEIIDDTTHKPKKLPCIIYKNREDVLRYIGYRHITGVKEWDSLSKAKYLKELCDTFYKNEEKDIVLKNLAREIGSRPHYVATLLTALNLYEVAHESDFFDLPMKAADVEFSYITTALGYSKITNWLGLKDKKDFIDPELNEENLKRIFSWFFVPDQQGRTIIGESRRIKDIAAVVEKNEAIDVLMKSSNLDEAYLYTSGEKVALDKALNAASVKLRVVWDMLLKAKEITAEHEESASDIFDMSKNIRNQIRSKREDD
ncbi:ParB N-terminal domain-containing protein [Morganella morganii]|uniref:ParB N-terminal domain-containing protein n=1 Tax=Morganella morganii TaxID=582 RepID=A0AAE4FFK6_MORMO|nr:ParB N-terminal domain-containing protein [Morganella morganii]MCT1588446.1 ParB N-terminal domain-containing protein [Morganella morganii]MDS0898974.1 ParB N-terminal domain-containing protein [Morganella morganii]